MLHSSAITVVDLHELIYIPLAASLSFSYAHHLRTGSQQIVGENISKNFTCHFALGEAGLPYQDLAIVLSSTSRYLQSAVVT
jgi:hypothetical protein